jgi:hypothetical protein
LKMLSGKRLVLTLESADLWAGNAQQRRIG